MCYEPTPGNGLVVGGGYYVLDRLADPDEVVTLIRVEGGTALVRGWRGVETVVPVTRLSEVPAEEWYRALRRVVEAAN